MITLLSVAVAILCGAASLYRLWIATSAIGLDPDTLDRSGEAGVRALGRCDASSIGKRLYLAQKTSDAGEFHEALMDLEFEFNRWNRVPRVCASVASSAAFLLAAWSLRVGLLTAEPGEEYTRMMLHAVNVAAIGLAAAVSCAAIHRSANQIARKRLLAWDHWIEKLEGENPVAKDFEAVPAGEA